jgi:hypothetical protein
MENRGDWATTVSRLLGEPSYLNVAASGTVDWNTRELNLLVEVYYTGDADIATNFLTVALLQNNIEGKQTGGSTLNPSQILPNGNYNHMHMLRDIISPVWGDTIFATTQGSLFSKTYTYAIPEKINTVDVLLEDIEIVAFVSKTKDTIISGAKSELTINNQPVLLATATLDDIAIQGLNNCNQNYSMFVSLRNRGTDAINKIKYNLLKNNQVVLQDQEWNARTIASGNRDTLLIRNSVIENTQTEFRVEITAINDQTYPYSSEVLRVTKNVVDNARGHMALKIVTDAFASETYYVIYDPSGNPIADNWSSPWSDLTEIGTTEHWIGFSPTATGCYLLMVEDTYGDGMNNGYGAGYIELLLKDGTQLFYNDGNFGAIAVYNINVTEAANTSVTDIDNSSTAITIFPNPANDYLYIQTNDNVKQLDVYNIQGQLIRTEQTNTSSVDINNLASGMYILRITSDKGVSTHKFVKK